MNEPFVEKGDKTRQKTRMTILRTFSASLLVVVSLFSSSVAFGLDLPCVNGEPCELSGKDGGTYHLTFPEDWDGAQKLKPFVFFHGHNGSGKGVARNKNLAKTVRFTLSKIIQ